MTCPAMSLFTTDPLQSPLQTPRWLIPSFTPCPASCPSLLKRQPWPTAGTPGQQLFGLVGENGTVRFHHADQCRDDAGLQEPFHPHVYEVLLVLGRRKDGSGYQANLYWN